MVFMASIDFDERKGKPLLRTTSFKKRRDLETTDASDQGQDNYETISFKRKKPDSITFSSPKQKAKFLSSGPAPELHAAATKLQKIYKSYRTRRNLADCAVVEELWWKVLEFAALRRSSISFFNSNKSETAISRWARARTRAAKVGKGLLKDVKGQKLALRHWLEAIDPRHRYGHNLHWYYEDWFASGSSQPFFYWLDVGDGKQVNLEKCPRTNLQRECIKYLGPKERESYEVVLEKGKLIYKQSKAAVNTVEGTKWIFVLSTSRILYVGQKQKGLFQHSSFLAGGATIASGRLVVRHGTLDAVWAYSGHYRPTEENFAELCSFLEEHHVDLTNVKKYPTDDDIIPSKVPIHQELKPESAKETSENVSSTNTYPIHGKENSSGQRHNEESGDTRYSLVEKAAPYDLETAVKNQRSTGVGPRIGRVRDYPAQLQTKALEQVNSSPRLKSGLTCGPILLQDQVRMCTSHRLAYLGLVSPRVRVSARN